MGEGAAGGLRGVRGSDKVPNDLFRFLTIKHLEVKSLVWQQNKALKIYFFPSSYFQVFLNELEVLKECFLKVISHWGSEKWQKGVMYYFNGPLHNASHLIE